MQDDLIEDESVIKYIDEEDIILINEDGFCSMLPYSYDKIDVDKLRKSFTEKFDEMYI